ncbi:MetQ/NlpA family ABC transporter substrate-binding protein [Corynebacterium sp. ES2794-CONJ1]|uniref:MetQ/NlpA family ABC transporter substrate-binding protein n=1 Tax=unclassified Corynebacterium TaxID=2624378 RepID=UPI00216766A5|nr:MULTISPECIES: MetQ/NlpA family ABC transporter substrate-binding protein [unclassified Corynebacterium]MCS4489546.1 MetQ/NlpA family ABC transporter substrate-binding protein [Corynebacterium sp. ES2775-CONJ]MCS4491443.1 MetQ/NlpA family ABC transporter substrate-binding protein [Corynebacterium sp. ES2715-CONJ3]MCS4531456.1 MetQ/NlpA family ABC transporter substrate-binding protein [Corynebacterium sp. ES2730-CONJ]MCU9518844.1 MetQ/NlpA family ABC transporter substrate-binding protein [Cory
MNISRIITVSTAALLAAGGLTACSNDTATPGGENSSTTIRIGTTDGTKKVWAALEEVAKENDITLDIVNFSDYSTPNLALSQDRLDVNLFQHLKFLAEYNVGNNADLVPVGATEIVPLALFWKDHSSLDGIEGETVIVPNDPSNLGRAINVLVQADLVTLKPAAQGSLTPTEADIIEKESKVKVTSVDAAQTTAAYGEGRPAIINNSFLDRAGIDPKLAIFQDDPNAPEAEPYINAFVVRESKKNDPTILKLAQLWHDPQVLAANAEDSKGTSVPVESTPEALQAILQRLEDQTK